MRRLHILLLALTMSLVSSCTTPPKKKSQLELDIGSIYGGTFAPIIDVFMLKYGALDLLYDSASFRHRNGRWPNDYTELSTFVQQSDGYPMLGEYERVDLKPLADGRLEVCYTRLGRTNKTTFTFGDILHGK